MASSIRESDAGSQLLPRSGRSHVLSAASLDHHSSAAVSLSSSVSWTVFWSELAGCHVADVEPLSTPVHCPFVGGSPLGTGTLTAPCSCCGNLQSRFKFRVLPPGRGRGRGREWSFVCRVDRV